MMSIIVSLGAAVYVVVNKKTTHDEKKLYSLHKSIQSIYNMCIIDM